MMEWATKKKILNLSGDKIIHLTYIYIFNLQMTVRNKFVVLA